jgi:hypothetical protein
MRWIRDCAGRCRELFAAFVLNHGRPITEDAECSEVAEMAME